MSINIYQNILADAVDRADICILDSRKEVTAQDFVLQLLQHGRLDFELHSTFQAAGTLQHLFFESRNQEKNIGDKLLGLGFPTLFVQLNGYNYIAPLFIWRMGMEASVSRINSWVFRHNDSYALEVNLHLLDALQRQYQTDFSDILFDFSENDQLSPADLQRICARLSNRLQLSFFQSNLQVMAQPTSLETRKLLTDGGLLWTGSIGLFPAQWKTEELPELAIKVDWSDMDQLPPPSHPFSLATLTPAQVIATRLLQSRRMTQVSYLYHDDQIQFIHHLITNALSHGHKCLVVAPNATVLRNVQNTLVQQQIRYLHFLLKEPVSDKSLLLELLKAIEHSDTLPSVSRPTDYEDALKQCGRYQITLEAHFNAIHRTAFGDENWMHLVGRFLRSNRTEDHALLSNHLIQSDFTFTLKEYGALRTAIELCKPLYQNISTLKHPLGELNADIFTKKTEAEGLQFIQEKTNYFLQKGKALQHQFINGQAAYATRLRTHYENRYAELLEQAEQVLNTIEEQRRMFGVDFKNASNWSLKLKGIVSGKSARMMEARDIIRSQYQQLQQAFEQHRYFDFAFAPALQPTNINQIQAQTQDFVAALQDWQTCIHLEVSEEVKRLSYQTALPSIAYREDLKMLEEALDALVVEINDARLLEVPLDNKMLTLGRKQNFLESILEQMEGAQYNLRDFNSFYKWHRNWLRLDTQARKVVQALIKVQPKIWIAAFESWYFHQILLQMDTVELPQSERTLLRQANQLKDFRPLLLEHIRYIWQERRKRATKWLRSQQKRTYQLIFGKKNHELCAERSLQEILRLGLPTVSEVLPVLLTTIDVAAHDLPQLAEHFDCVIFSDTQQLTAESCAALLPMGKRIVAIR
ncbi:MAG: hypothetical protein AAGK47_04985, partial [Bacteroidota bacterium]